MALQNGTDFYCDPPILPCLKLNYWDINRFQIRRANNRSKRLCI